MRTSERILAAALVGVGLGLASAFALDGTHAPAGTALDGSLRGPIASGIDTAALPEARPADGLPGERPPQQPLVSASSAARSLVQGAVTPDAARGHPAPGPLAQVPLAPAPLAGPLAAMPVAPDQLAPVPLGPLPPEGALSDVPLTSFQAFQSGTRALRAGDTKGALRALEYAAARGYPVAAWKLGRMYADGDGVMQSDLRAFEYFRAVADAHADEVPGTPQARFIANAFVALGNYYLAGIADSAVRADTDHARDMYAYAASYFGDPDAQYHLGRMYLEGSGGAKDPKQASRWLSLAARKGQYQAQAVLGSMLFNGEYVPRQASRGLMWLTLARDAAPPRDSWITDLHAAALKQATEDERAIALVYLERWLRVGRD